MSDVRAAVRIHSSCGTSPDVLLPPRTRVLSRCGFCRHGEANFILATLADDETSLLGNGDGPAEHVLERPGVGIGGDCSGGYVVAGSQGRRSASMTSAWSIPTPCLTAVAR